MGFGLPFSTFHLQGEQVSLMLLEIPLANRRLTRDGVGMRGKQSTVLRSAVPAYRNTLIANSLEWADAWRRPIAEHNPERNCSASGGGYIPAMAQERADSELVEAFLAGDQNAAKDLEAQIQAVFRHWRARFGHETDDILSDVWLELLESLRQSEFKYQASLKSYIRQIVNHTCIDYLRFRKRVHVVDPESIELEDDCPNPEQILARKQTANIAFRVLRRMPEECRQMWRMKLQQGLSCLEIGQALKKTEGNIRRRLWACREEARKIREKITQDKLFLSSNATGGRGD